MPWNACNFNCKHCANESHANSSEFLSDDLIDQVIFQASEVFGKDWCLSISGGEPFLYFDKLMSLCKKTQERNGYVTLMTNCFWAKNKSDTEKIVFELSQNGVAGIGISFDNFHAEFVNKEWMVML